MNFYSELKVTHVPRIYDEQKILDELDCIRFQQAETGRLVERRHLIINILLYSTHTHAHIVGYL